MKTLISIVSAGLLTLAAGTASAAPMELTSGQMDNVTAGGSYIRSYYSPNFAFADAKAKAYGSSTVTDTYTSTKTTPYSSSSKSSSFSCSSCSVH